MHPAAVRGISSTALLVLLSLSGWKRSKQPLPRTARNASLTPEERYVPLRREPAAASTSLLSARADHARSSLRARSPRPRGRDTSMTRWYVSQQGSTPLSCSPKPSARRFLHEVDNYDASGLPVRRPNSMNMYGLIVNEIGMRDAITELAAGDPVAVARFLFPLQSTRFDAHHSFIVRYKSDEDPGLDMHTDDSDVTFNACLNSNFTRRRGRAGLTFCGDAARAP